MPREFDEFKKIESRFRFSTESSPNLGFSTFSSIGPPYGHNGQTPSNRNAIASLKVAFSKSPTSWLSLGA